jgi:hypothetical protein
VARGVDCLRHSGMDGAVLVVAEGSVGVLVVEGLVLRLLLAFATALVSALRIQRGKGVVVEVPV